VSLMLLTMSALSWSRHITSLQRLLWLALFASCVSGGRQNNRYVFRSYSRNILWGCSLMNTSKIDQNCGLARSDDRGRLKTSWKPQIWRF
jgi:hypothetical protein